jgi:hypothetical protein
MSFRGHVPYQWSLCKNIGMKDQSIQRVYSRLNGLCNFADWKANYHKSQNIVIYEHSTSTKRKRTRKMPVNATYHACATDLILTMQCKLPEKVVADMPCNYERNSKSNETRNKGYRNSWKCPHK